MANSSQRRIVVAAAVLVATALTLAVAWGRSGAPAEAAPGEGWVGTWASALAPAGGGIAGKGFTNQTVRMTVRTSVGGDETRIRLSNAYGTQPLTVGRATLALPVANDTPQIQPATLRELTFDGRQQVTVPKGGQVLSDPVPMPVRALQELTVSVFLPAATGPVTFQFNAREPAYIGAGDQAAKAEYTVTDSRNYWFFLSGVDVRTRHAAGAVAVLGDSLTAANGSTLGLHRRWTDYLAARLQDDPGEADPAVLNLGLAGNALAHDGSEIGFPELGVNGLARFLRDAPGQTGVRTVVVALGINDIQIYDDSPERVIFGLRQLATQARQLGLRVLACTLGPFQGFTSWTPGKENTRLAVNAYLRDSDQFDDVIDVDAVLRDPDASGKLRAAFDSGDHIHPNDAGNEAIAKAVPLDLLTGS
nr:GDSL-type esterase/lipase family protein [Catellatospora coxensis]